MHGEVAEADRIRKPGRAKYTDNISNPANTKLRLHLILDIENGWLHIFIAVFQKRMTLSGIQRLMTCYAVFYNLKHEASLLQDMAGLGLIHFCMQHLVKEQ